MKLDIGKVVDHITRGSCIPTDSVKSGDDHPNLVHNTAGPKAHQSSFDDD